MTEYTKEQQAENRAMWVAALRSGEFQQAQETLKNKEGHCCLGVACELAASEGIVRERRAGYFVDSEGYGSTASLPSVVMNWLGLASAFGTLVDRDDIHGDLAGMNDEGCTFAEIADVIEAGKVRLAE